MSLSLLRVADTFSSFSYLQSYGQNREICSHPARGGVDPDVIYRETGWFFLSVRTASGSDAVDLGI